MVYTVFYSGANLIQPPNAPFSSICLSANSQPHPLAKAGNSNKSESPLPPQQEVILCKKAHSAMVPCSSHKLPLPWPTKGEFPNLSSLLYSLPIHNSSFILMPT